jgi:hypothetical protein
VLSIQNVIDLVSDYSGNEGLEVVDGFRIEVDFESSFQGNLFGEIGASRQEIIRYPLYYFQAEFLSGE